MRELQLPMDILLVETSEGSQIRPESIHGMLWLQTHFEQDHWVAIASKSVVLSPNNAKELSDDARKAGLSINLIPSILVARNS